MSAPVDVLAILDMAIGGGCELTRVTIHRTRAKQVRAAVAAIIEERDALVAAVHALRFDVYSFGDKKLIVPQSDSFQKLQSLMERYSELQP